MHYLTIQLVSYPQNSSSCPNPGEAGALETCDCNNGLIAIRSALICSLVSLPLSAEGDMKVVALDIRPRKQ